MPALPALRLPPHLPRGTRPYARRGVAQIRLGRRLAAGLTPAQAGRAEGVEPAEIETLLADPSFTSLIEECRALDALPDEEKRRRLTSAARWLLQDCVALGDIRAALFVLSQEHRGRDPAVVLADGVIAAGRRAARTAEPAPAPLPPPAGPPPSREHASSPADPADRAVWNVAGRLRGALVCELAALHRATAPEAPAPVEATPVVEATPPPAPEAPVPAKTAGKLHPAGRAASKRPSLDALASRIGHATAIRLFATPGSPGAGRLPRRPRAP